MSLIHMPNTIETLGIQNKIKLLHKKGKKTLDERYEEVII